MNRTARRSGIALAWLAILAYSAGMWFLLLHTLPWARLWHAVAGVLS